MNMYYPPVHTGQAPTIPGTGSVQQPQPYTQDPNQSLIRMPYIVPPPQPQQLSALPGRVINSPDEVTPNEVPNDGRFGIFPTADNSAIYLKGWTSDGRIQTIKFIQAVEAEVPKVPENVVDFSAEFAQIRDELAEIRKGLNKKPHYYDSRQKKGDTE